MSFYNLMQFAFKTQIYEKKLPLLLKKVINKDISQILSQSTYKSTKEDNLSKLFVSAESKHEPCNLEIEFKSKTMMKRK